MAPNKKKKKTATSNPARGFATTSVASKQKSQDIELPPPTKERTDARSESDAPDSLEIKHNFVSDSGATSEKQLYELSPEELEAHLEESDLQAFLEKNGEKVKRETSRQVVKLMTERRILRAQAESLHTRQWLQQEIITQVQNQISEESMQFRKFSNPSSSLSLQKLSDDDILLQVWKLFLTLRGLDFSLRDTEEAVSHLLQRNYFYSNSLTTKTAKDSVRGLDESFDLLALKLASNKVWDYNEQDKAGLRRNQDFLRANSLETLDSKAGSGSSPSDLTPDETFSTNQSPSQSDVAISDLENDLEPEQMIDKYILLQTQLYHLHPSFVVQSQNNIGKRQKNKAQPPKSTENVPNQKARRIHAQIAQITSDILFDKEHAESRWASKYIELCQDEALRRHLDPDEEPDSLSRNSPPAKSSEAPDTEEPDIMLGSFFSTLPDISTDSANENVEMSSSEQGEIVKIRSFEKWTGIGPKRILEEACKARDPLVRVKFQLVSQNPFSCRHVVSLQWAKPQLDNLITPYKSIMIKISNHRNVHIEMISVSCPDSTQSEAFVATLALYIIFAQSPREEKVHLRLPPVWRELWSEMAQIKKEADDTSDREILRKLRYMIAQDERVESGTNGLDQPLSIVEKHSKPHLNTDNSSILSDSLKAIWSSISTARAYQAMLKSRQALPIWTYRRNILEAIEKNQVVIVCGATGCGKSTQVPAYILENELSKGRVCKIHCTEPRRISAISLARRVSEELGETKGDVGTIRSLVGFAIRLESHVTAQTRLVYATTGIIMRMLEGSRGLDDITHLLLDEVHERSIESDFLLIILRKLLTKRPSLKVVLMSATVDAKKFSCYFNSAPIFEVPGRTFPVDTKYLEDAVELTNYRPSLEDGSSIEAEDADHESESVNEMGHRTSGSDYLTSYSAETRRTVAKLNEYRIPYDLIVKLLESVHTGHLSEYSKATLIFLPGIAEIRRLNDMLSVHSQFARRCEIFALHSSIATEDQERAFLIPPPGKRKIVLATNIAETGITIPDVTCVIDTGKQKEIRFDERRQLSRLIEAFISKANATQRRGRAGRVQKGLCFHLFSKQRFERLPLEPTPEMLRLSLQDLILRIKICKLGGIEETLSEALDPPSTKNIRRATDALQDVKALTLGQDLTSLGKQLARLPLDVFLGKLLLLGVTFSCLDATLTIAAILSTKSPFVSTVGNRSQADQARLSFKNGDSDLLTVYNAYSAWRRVCNTAGMSEQNFCRKSCLSPQTLSNIEDIKMQLMTSLVDADFVKIDRHEKSMLINARHYNRRRVYFEVPARYDANGTNNIIINSVTAMSFYPKLLKREGKGWRNVANNQSISLHPTSVNKHSDGNQRWISFYHIMQSTSKFYNAHETSTVEDIAVALLCGEADFKMYAGVIVIDGNRIKFSVSDWQTMLVLKTLRVEMKAIIEQQIRCPGRFLTESEQRFMDIWQKLFTRQDKASKE